MRKNYTREGKFFISNDYYFSHILNSSIIYELFFGIKKWKMPQMDNPSFLDWEKRKFKKPKDKKNEYLDSNSSDSFITILPAWKTKKNYALININYRRFKLFEHGNSHLKKFIQDLLEWFLYVDPNEYNNEMQDILNYVNENKRNFKIYWDDKLRVY